MPSLMALAGRGIVAAKFRIAFPFLTSKQVRILTRRASLDEGMGEVTVLNTPRLRALFDDQLMGSIADLSGPSHIRLIKVEKGFIERQRVVQFVLANKALVGGHLGFLVALGLAALAFPGEAGEVVDRFKEWTTANPWSSSAIKFALLGTYGDMLGGRVATGKWNFSLRDNLSKLLYWAGAGVAIKGAFKIYFGGMDVLAEELPFLKTQIFGLSIFKAFLTSAVLNSTFYPLLVKAHASYDQHAEALKQNFSVGRLLTEPLRFAKDLATCKFLKIKRDWIPLAKRFWLPAHTITPLLPPVWQILYAALLCPVLGVDVGVRAAEAKKQKA
ncbi:MAG: hypothetical protein NT099_03975 [Candidatus Saganbacteria bacterium]|nr:hypothetical protein [Candidatus Saganbacteria bacterium]